MTKKQLQQPKVPKGDPNKTYDVIVSVVHDDRQGKTAPVQKPVRVSFETEAEAVDFSAMLNQLMEGKK